MTGCASELSWPTVQFDALVEEDVEEERNKVSTQASLSGKHPHHPRRILLAAAHSTTRQHSVGGRAAAPHTMEASTQDATTGEEEVMPVALETSARRAAQTVNTNSGLIFTAVTPRFRGECLGGTPLTATSSDGKTLAQCAKYAANLKAGMFSYNSGNDKHCSPYTAEQCRIKGRHSYGAASTYTLYDLPVEYTAVTPRYRGGCLSSTDGKWEKITSTSSDGKSLKECARYAADLKAGMFSYNPPDQHCNPFTAEQCLTKGRETYGEHSTYTLYNLQKTAIKSFEGHVSASKLKARLKTQRDAEKLHAETIKTAQLERAKKLRAQVREANEFSCFGLLLR